METESGLGSLGEKIMANSAITKSLYSIEKVIKSKTSLESQKDSLAPICLHPYLQSDLKFTNIPVTNFI